MERREDFVEPAGDEEDEDLIRSDEPRGTVIMALLPQGGALGCAVFSQAEHRILLLKDAQFTLEDEDQILLYPGSTDMETTEADSVNTMPHPLAIESNDVLRRRGCPTVLSHLQKQQRALH